MIERAKIPVLVKHTTLAIYLNVKGLGSGKRRFLAALSIARASLTRSGYLMRGSDKPGLTGDVGLTTKGGKREKEHTSAKDPGRAMKVKAFDALFDFAAGRGKLKDAKPLVLKAARHSGKRVRPKPVAPIPRKVGLKRSRKVKAQSVKRVVKSKSRAKRVKRSKKARRAR